MMIVRPIAARDHEALWKIAKKTGAGFTSLQPDEQGVAGKLQWALASFGQGASKPVHRPGEHLYLFVMEDTQTGEVVGTTGIESAVGLTSPWYNYKVSKQVHASQKLGVYTMVETLMLCNDHTGFSELCTLFLCPEARHSSNGSLLSKSRFMFMAAFSQLFSDNVIAEMRGFSDEDDVSPFWEALGRHFFSVDFAEADRHISADKAVIAQLMPRHPIYINMLPEKAQAVIARTHQSTTPARHLLESEGFHYTGYVDIFDAGPLLEARVKDIRAARDSRLYKARVVENPTTDERLWLVSNDDFHGFRCTAAPLSFEGLEYVHISLELADALNIEEGQPVRAVPLASPERS